MMAALVSGDEKAIKEAMMIRMGNARANSSCTCGHYYAWFALERNQAVLDHITPIAIEKGYGDMIPPIQASLDSARAQLEDVGFSPFQPGQAESIWNDIKDANTSIRDLIGLLRNSTERPPFSIADSSGRPPLNAEV
jgi:hypothetical protein